MQHADVRVMNVEKKKPFVLSSVLKLSEISNEFNHESAGSSSELTKNFLD